MDQRSISTRLADRFVERCEDIPDDPDPGNYVVVDVLHFSNTVIELLANGASHVHVTAERGREFAYRREHPSAKIGGGRTDEWTPSEGYDFFNSPSYVGRLDLDDDPACLWSTNGGRAVATLRERATPDVDVYVGSTMNAAALGRHLRGTDRPTHLVAAGSRGAVATEDVLGATLIGRYIDGPAPSPAERDRLRRTVRTAKGPGYVETHPIRRRDVCQYATNLNARAVLPKLSGAGLIDLAAGRDGAPSAPSAAD